MTTTETTSVLVATLKYIEAFQANRKGTLFDGGYVYGVEEARRYIRIFKRTSPSDSSRSIVMFVDRETGALFRAKSWKQVGAATGRTVFDLEALKAIGE